MRDTIMNVPQCTGGVVTRIRAPRCQTERPGGLLRSYRYITVVPCVPPYVRHALCPEGRRLFLFLALRVY